MSFQQICTGVHWRGSSLPWSVCIWSPPLVNWAFEGSDPALVAEAPCFGSLSAWVPPGMKAKWQGPQPLNYKAFTFPSALSGVQFRCLPQPGQQHESEEALSRTILVLGSTYHAYIYCVSTAGSTHGEKPRLRSVLLPLSWSRSYVTVHRLQVLWCDLTRQNANCTTTSCWDTRPSLLFCQAVGGWGRAHL